jgi:putative transcriptional regulator
VGESEHYSSGLENVMKEAFKLSGHPTSGDRLPTRSEKAASARGWALLLLLLAAFWGVGGKPCWGQEKPKNKLCFLVARRSILDPIFAKSVVLMLPLEGEPLIVGLIVNRPTRLPLVELFPKSPTLKNSSADAYLGGPVDVETAALIFHAAKAPKQAMLLYDDVYLSFDGKLISRLMQDPKQTGDVRLFLGRAQWAPKQLQDEALEGSWYSLRAEGEVIFDRDSEHLWKRLHERARPPESVENSMPHPSRVRLRTAPAHLPSFLLCTFPTEVN